MGDELERGQVRSVTAPAQELQDSVPSGGVSSFSEVKADRQQLADLDTERLSVLTSRPKWEVASVDTQRLVGVAPPVVPVLSPPAAARTPTIATQRQRAQAAVQRAQASVQQAQAAVQRAQASAPWQRAQAWAIEHVRALHLVAGVAIILSVASYLYYSHLGITLAYGDALSHMMIARRVVAGRTPGLAQLGQFWLPLTHVLMLPFIWNDWLFRAGLAGSIPSMAAYVVGAIYMYRLARECFGTAAAGWLAAFGWMLNPNLLYMQATAMTEAPLICTAVIVIFYAVRWVKYYAPIDLVKSATAVMAATLIRYDGWPLAVGLAVIVFIVAWNREGSSGAIANGILFSVLAFSGCVGWILYNQILFGDGLGWYNGKYSAAFQEQRIAAQGGLPTYHNVVLSLKVYLQTVIDTVSLPIIILAVLGILFWTFRSRLRLVTWPVYLLIVPFLFNWLALVQGSTIIRTPEFPVNGIATWFNDRYGMELIPLVTLFLGVLVAHRFALLRRMTLAICLVFLTIVMLANTFGQIPYVLYDPLHGGNVNVPIEQKVIGQYLDKHYSGGLMLLSYSPFAPAVFYSGLPDDDFLTDGNGPQYDAALADPAKTGVTWILFDPGSVNYDPISAAVRSKPTLLQGYTLVATFGTAQLYERNSNASRNP